MIVENYKNIKKYSVFLPNDHKISNVLNLYIYTQSASKIESNKITA